MAAVAGFPSLSQLLAWPTEHLTEAADHWEAVGGRSYGGASQVWRDALSIDWHGDGAVGHDAEIAQAAEHATDNRAVGLSSGPLCTKFLLREAPVSNWVS